MVEWVFKEEFAENGVDVGGEGDAEFDLVEGGGFVCVCGGDVLFVCFGDGIYWE